MLTASPLRTAFTFGPMRWVAASARRLLRALLEHGSVFGFRTVIAVIGGAEPGSVALHANCGFREVGRLRAVGWKRSRWLDSVYMQVELREPD